MPPNPMPMMTAVMTLVKKVISIEPIVFVIDFIFGFCDMNYNDLKPNAVSESGQLPTNLERKRGGYGDKTA